MSVQTTQTINTTFTNSTSINSTNPWSDTYNTVCDIGMFVWNRVPNIQEITKMTFPYAGIQVLFGALPFKFGGNPTAKAVFRDAMKTPPVVIASYHGLEIGKTGIHYDEGNLVGALTKTACKVGAIGSATYFYPALLAGPVGWMTIGGVALGANFGCEIPARTFKVTSREYQVTCKNNTTCSMSYWEFMWENLGSLFLRGAQEAIPKTFTSDVLVGNTLKPLFNYIGDYANKASSVLGVLACSKLTGIQLDLSGHRGMYTKSCSCLAVGTSTGVVAKFITYGIFGIIELVTVTGREILTTVTFVPIVSSVADSSIPDMIFGSETKLASTTAGTAIAITCVTTTALAFPICTAVGVIIKAGSDFAWSYYNAESGTAEVSLAGEGSTHEEL